MISPLYAPLSRGARRLPAALAALALTLCGVASASAEGGSVRYSYEKVEIAGSTQWVLVPRAEMELALNGKAPSKGKVIEAFKLLKNKKKSSYGEADIKIGGGSWPSKAQVSVTIDPKFATYAPIVMAEVVYTLTELGVGAVDFPGYSNGSLSRRDVPFAVYTLTVPMWQALPPQKLSHAQALMADGSTLHIEELYARWKRKDEALYKEIYSFLNSENLSTAVLVLRKLPELDIPYVEQVMPMLAHATPMVRREALTALEARRDDQAVSQAVAAQLEQEQDVETAAAQAAFLGATKNASFAVLEPLWALQRSGDEERAVQAAGKLVEYKQDERVMPALYKALTSSSAPVAQAALAALAAADEDAWQIKALGDAKLPAEMKSAVALDLIADRDDTARIEGLGYLVEHASEREAERALTQLAAQKSDPARQRLETYLMDEKPWRRRAAALALVERGEGASLPALAKAIKRFDQDDELERAGYELMVKQPSASIQQNAKASDAITQRLAYLALGEQARKSGGNKGLFETLKAGTQSGDAMVRGASARALGAFANKEAAETLSTLHKDKKAEVRRDVAIALGDFKGGEMIEVLTGYLDDASPQVVAAAIDSLGARGEGSAWERIKGAVGDKEPEVRASALRALSRLVDRKDRAAVVEMINTLSGALSDKNPMIRQRAIEQLGTFKDENAVLAISSQLNSDDLKVRVAALRALGTSGHPAARDLLVDALSDPNLDVRYAATEGLADFGDASTSKALKERSEKEQNAPLKALMLSTSKKL